MIGYAGQTLAKPLFLNSSYATRLEPEFRRRIIALMDECVAAGKPIGIGGAWRSSEQQKALFLSRYHLEDDNDFTGDVFWNGMYWEKAPGVAPAAPPGASYHEPCTVEGYCLAVDLVGDTAYAATIAGKHGLVQFGNINGEIWHHQPAELPHSRRKFTSSMVPLRVFGGVPAPQPPKPPKPHVVVPAPTLKLVTPINLTGPEVLKLQTIMQFWGWYPKSSKCDGWFGPVTAQAVGAMQKALNITPDRIYGPVTAAKYKAFAEYMATVAS